MEDGPATEVDVSFNDLLDYTLCLGLLYFFLLVEKLHEVAMGAILGDEVVEVFGLIRVVELHNIGMTQISMDFYLALKHCDVRCFELLQVYYFNCIEGALFNANAAANAESF